MRPATRGDADNFQDLRMVRGKMDFLCYIDERLADRSTYCPETLSAEERKARCEAMESIAREARLSKLFPTLVEKLESSLEKTLEAATDLAEVRLGEDRPGLYGDLAEAKLALMDTESALVKLAGNIADLEEVQRKLAQTASESAV